ncbi:MAG: choice-of-anchor D domain-containing protein [Deltaproteobacteria bacterium]|nr:choice-of-anchor D domain-containing protein [Deltaproteobacteria bacterium]
MVLVGTGLSPGDLEITSDAVLNFNTIERGSESGMQTLTVRNNGGTATAALSVILGDETNYAKVAGDTCDGVALNPSASCMVQVRFTPTVVGSLPAQLSVLESEGVGVAASLLGTGSARLAVTKTGSGTGTVISTQTGINCGAACPSMEASFTASPITLTASVVSGHAFEGWGGACAHAGMNPECMVPLSQAATSVTAEFRAWDCTPDTISCNDATDHYVDCSPTGTVEVEMD